MNQLNLLQMNQLNLLQTAKFANLVLHSDTMPYEIVKVISAKCIELRPMKAEKGVWHPEVHPGGFCAHVSNQHEQTWVITPDETAGTIRARLHKNGQWRSSWGRHVLSAEPRKFYDFNF
jgi:hypothetical protein